MRGYRLNIRTRNEPFCDQNPMQLRFVRGAVSGVLADQTALNDGITMTLNGHVSSDERLV